MYVCVPIKESKARPKPLSSTNRMCVCVCKPLSSTNRMCVCVFVCFYMCVRRPRLKSGPYSVFAFLTLLNFTNAELLVPSAKAAADSGPSFYSL